TQKNTSDVRASFRNDTALVRYQFVTATPPPHTPKETRTHPTHQPASPTPTVHEQPANPTAPSPSPPSAPSHPCALRGVEPRRRPSARRRLQRPMPTGSTATPSTHVFSDLYRGVNNRTISVKNISLRPHPIGATRPFPAPRHLRHLTA